MVSKSQNRPTRRLEPCTIGHLVDLEGSLGCTWWDPPGSLGPNKMIFSKVIPRPSRPLGMLKQVFLAHFEPVVTRFDRRKSPNDWEMGCFRTFGSYLRIIQSGVIPLIGCNLFQLEEKVDDVKTSLKQWQCETLGETAPPTTVAHSTTATVHPVPQQMPCNSVPNPNHNPTPAAVPHCPCSSAYCPSS